MITASETGNVIIKDDARSTIKSNTARVSRVATLDGGVVITHSGFSDGDRTLSISGRTSAADEDILWTLFRYQTFLLFSTPDGLFYGSIKSLQTDNGKLSISILVKEKDV